MEMRPASGCSKPATMRSVVVLPQPEGPSSVSSSPGSTVRLTSFTAASAAWPSRVKRLDTCCSSSRRPRSAVVAISVYPPSRVPAWPRLPALSRRIARLATATAA